VSTPISPEWEKYGFYDPASSNAIQRRVVLAFYEAQGLDPADFADVEPVDLVQVVNRRRVRHGTRVDAAEAGAAARIDPELFDDLSRVAGYPQHGRQYTQADIGMFELFNAAVELFSVDEMMHFTTVMSSSMARVADAATALFRIDVSSELEATGGTELDFAKKNFEAAELVRLMKDPLWSLFALHLELSAERGDESRLAIDRPGADASLVKLGVGFVDLVGFTPMTEAMQGGELGRFIRDFEQLATGIISSHGGRLVKLIGDEVMFVAVGASESVHIAAELMEAFSKQGVQPHGGVVHGELVARGGDYYGQAVNLASRIAGLAVPDELLVDEATAAGAFDHQFEAAGRRQIKGFAEPVQLKSLLPAPLH